MWHLLFVTGAKVNNNHGWKEPVSSFFTALCLRLIWLKRNWKITSFYTKTCALLELKANVTLGICQLLYLFCGFLELSVLGIHLEKRQILIKSIFNELCMKYSQAPSHTMQYGAFMRRMCEIWAFCREILSGLVLTLLVFIYLWGQCGVLRRLLCYADCDPTWHHRGRTAEQVVRRVEAGGEEGEAAAASVCWHRCEGVKGRCFGVWRPAVRRLCEDRHTAQVTMINVSSGCWLASSSSGEPADVQPSACVH